MPLHQKRYLTNFTANFESQKLLQAALKLYHQAHLEGNQNDDLQVKCENIDMKATKIMLTAERTCLPKFPSERE